MRVVVHHAGGLKFPAADSASFLILDDQRIRGRLIQVYRGTSHSVADIRFERRHIGVVWCPRNVVNHQFAILVAHVADEPSTSSRQPGPVTGPTDQPKSVQKETSW